MAAITRPAAHDEIRHQRLCASRPPAARSAYQALAPTAAKADKVVDDRLATPITADANDFIYQWEASQDYDPSAGLEKIEAATLLINAADDERNPPETGVTEAAMKRVKNGKLYLIPASPRRAAIPPRARQNSTRSRCGNCCRARRSGRCEPGQSQCPRRFRRAALGLPDAVEGAHAGHRISVSASASSPRSAIPTRTGAW